jgi:hypothetical protein
MHDAASSEARLAANKARSPSIPKILMVSLSVYGTPWSRVSPDPADFVVSEKAHQF